MVLKHLLIVRPRSSSQFARHLIPERWVDNSKLSMLCHGSLGQWDTKVTMHAQHSEEICSQGMKRLSCIASYDKMKHISNKILNLMHFAYVISAVSTTRNLIYAQTEVYH